MNGGGGGDDENDEREKGGKWKSINHLSKDGARKQRAKIKLMEEAQVDEDMDTWEEIRDSPSVLWPPLIFFADPPKFSDTDSVFV